jgi:ribosomal protein L32E
MPAKVQGTRIRLPTGRFPLCELEEVKSQFLLRGQFRLSRVGPCWRRRWDRSGCVRRRFVCAEGAQGGQPGDRQVE